MKQNFRPPSLATELLAASPLGRSLARIELHRSILLQVRDALPDTLAEHCRDCAATSDQRLILFTDGPAWAFQLRFHAPSLVEKLSDFGIRSIEIRNLPAAETMKRKPPPATSLASARLLQNCAREASSGELAAAFSRLAATLESKSSERNL